MIYGIVGVEQAKLTSVTETAARRLIMSLLSQYDVTGVCSGECHLGGIDLFAHEIADLLGVPFTPFPPSRREWTAYKRRNMQIAAHSTHVICITVKTYPPSFTDTRYGWCYHCKTSEHVKSGGCWTVKYGKSIGRMGEVIVL